MMKLFKNKNNFSLVKKSLPCSFAIRPYSEFEKKEHADEERYARERDRQLIEKLKKNNQSQAKEEKKPEKENRKNRDDDDNRGQTITVDEFLIFRKEMVEKVRDLEDEVISLKYKLNQLKNQITNK
eukprot:TRINITY_DN102_c0_g1_i1.p1 TRINITY_DN102_c0_g1~~TRINITY_DN102_c0_g1_i1.p1  ORF type:complete len:126 (-),score=52.98 TRINITY_DN102_c0_g1_i1:54-431(-)